MKIYGYEELAIYQNGQVEIISYFCNRHWKKDIMMGIIQEVKQ